MPSFGELFVEPLLRNGFFNPANTAIFAVVLIAAIYAVFKLLSRLGVRIDRYFALAVAPYILFAASFRVLRDYSFSLAQKAAAEAGTIGLFRQDIVFQFSQIQQAGAENVLRVVPSEGFAGLYSSILAVFPTPGSYIITFIFAFSVFLLSFFLSKALARKGVKVEYWKMMVIPALALSALNLAILPFAEAATPLLILGVAAAATGITYGAVYFFRKRIGNLLDWRNQAIIAAHYIDASATYFAITFLGYGEQHFLPRFLFEAIGPWTFFILKPLVVLPALWVLDRDKSDRNFTNFLKIAIFILGLAPGLRSLIRLAVGGGV